MKSIGEILKAERERLGLDLKEAERQTRIQAKYLDAIEKNNWKALPSGSYSKAFVRTYASCLGLDPGPLVAQVSVIEDPEIQESQTTNFHRPARSHKMLIGVLSGLIAFGLLLSIGQREQRSAPPQGSSSADAEVSADEPKPNEFRLVEDESLGRVPAEVVTQGTGLPLTVRVMPEPGKVVWVRAIADGQKAYEGVMPAGIQERWEVRKRLYLRVGDAGAVRVYLNGTRITDLGEPGEVVERLFVNGEE